MPKQLTTRGHRLVYSNGILTLALAAVALLVVTDAKVDRLIPLYAIGVFTSFTLSQAGMAKHHLTNKEPGWRNGLFVNATGAVMSLVVDIVIAITKFTHGAWVIVVLVPTMVAALVRLNRQYEAEADELADEWRRLGLSRLPLEIVDCPDRRVTFAVATLVGEELVNGDTEVSVLVPRREYRRAWHRLLHDRTSNQLAAALSRFPHVNVTFVPYHLGRNRT
jgi:hypothetical protein